MLRKSRNLCLYPNVYLMDQFSSQIRTIRPLEHQDAVRPEGGSSGAEASSHLRELALPEPPVPVVKDYEVVAVALHLHEGYHLARLLVWSPVYSTLIHRLLLSSSEAILGDWRGLG